MEVHGGEGVHRFFRYIADRTDIALGLFNSASSGYVLAPEEVARIANEIPAVCAMKEGLMEPWRSKAAHALAPGLVIWECDTIVYKAGWLQQGIVGPAQLGTTGYLHETPEKRILTTYWNLVWDGRLAEAIQHALDTGLDQISGEVGSWFTRYPGRPDYFTHWGEAFRYAARSSGFPSAIIRTRARRRGSCPKRRRSRSGPRSRRPDWPASPWTHNPDPRIAGRRDIVPTGRPITSPGVGGNLASLTSSG